MPLPRGFSRSAPLALALAAACSPAPAPPLRAPQLPAPSASAPPPVPARDPLVAIPRLVQETRFGTAVVDPYRWMEDPGSPELAAWLDAQAERARRHLSALPEQPVLAARLRELEGSPRQAWEAQRWGGRQLYLAAAPGQRARGLYVRDGAGAPERLLVDSPTGVEAFEPSFDGRLVAFSTAPSGPTRVVETVSGRVSADAVAGASAIAWRHDSRSFFYTRASTQGAGVLVHVVGEDPARDRPVIGRDVGSGPPIGAGDGCWMITPPGSRYVFAVIRPAGGEAIAIHGAAPAAVPGSDVPWRKLVDAADQAIAFDVHGDSLYLLTRRDAPRGRVVRTSLTNPAPARAETVIAEGAQPITALGAARDGLFVRRGDGRRDQLLRVPFRRGHGVEAVALPAEGAILAPSTEPLVDGVLFQLAAWTAAPRWYAYDPAAEGLVDARLVPPSPVAVPMLATTALRARAEGGAPIALALVHKGELAPGAGLPVLLAAEAGAPRLSPARLAWLDRGYALAFCDARAAAEIAACARELLASRLASPGRLAADGRGAAAAAFAAVMTRSPELFTAVVLGDGAFDSPREGPAASATEEGFRASASEDAYSHVTAGAPYPAVLFVPDARAPRWQAGKLAARLQAATSSGKPILLLGGESRLTTDEEADALAFLLEGLFAVHGG